MSFNFGQYTKKTNYDYIIPFIQNQDFQVVSGEATRQEWTYLGENEGGQDFNNDTYNVKISITPRDEDQIVTIYLVDGIQLIQIHSFTVKDKSVYNMTSENSFSLNFEKSFSVKTKIYDKICIKVTTVNAVSAPEFSASVDKVSELLSSNAFPNRPITHYPLVRIGIQGQTGLRFFVNQNELTIGRNKVFEVYSKNMVITSLRVIPKDGFFLIDYEY